MIILLQADASSNNAIAAMKNYTTGLSIYPNPVSNAAISFTLSQSQKVIAQVFDGEGRLVKTIANEQMPAGAHQGSTVSKGIYYLKFNAGNYVETEKISVIR